MARRWRPTPASASAPWERCMPTASCSRPSSGGAARGPAARCRPPSTISFLRPATWGRVPADIVRNKAPVRGSWIGLPTIDGIIPRPVTRAIVAAALAGSLAACMGKAAPMPSQVGAGGGAMPRPDGGSGAAMTGTIGPTPLRRLTHDSSTTTPFATCWPSLAIRPSSSRLTRATRASTRMPAFRSRACSSTSITAQPPTSPPEPWPRDWARWRLAPPAPTRSSAAPISSRASAIGCSRPRRWPGQSLREALRRRANGAWATAAGWVGHPGDAAVAEFSLPRRGRAPGLGGEGRRDSADRLRVGQPAVVLPVEWNPRPGAPDAGGSGTSCARPSRSPPSRDRCSMIRGRGRWSLRFTSNGWRSRASPPPRAAIPPSRRNCARQWPMSSWPSATACSVRATGAWKHCSPLPFTFARGPLFGLYGLPAPANPRASVRVDIPAVQPRAGIF